MLVDFSEIRKTRIMSITTANTTILFYIAVMVFAIGVLILVYTGRMDARRSKTSRK